MVCIEIMRNQLLLKLAMPADNENNKNICIIYMNTHVQQSITIGQHLPCSRRRWCSLTLFASLLAFFFNLHTLQSNVKRTVIGKARKSKIRAALRNYERFCNFGKKICLKLITSRSGICVYSKMDETCNRIRPDIQIIIEQFL